MSWISTVPLLLFILALGNHASAEQTKILVCNSDNLDQTEIYSVYKVAQGQRVRHLLIQEFPYAPYHRQAWLTKAPDFSKGFIQIHERTTQGHIDIAPDPNSDDGKWTLDININGIVVSHTASYRCS